MSATDRHALFIVVHHPADPSRPYANQWTPNQPLALLAFTTPTKVAERAAAHGRLFVHRCGHAGSPPMIVCEARVVSVMAVDRHEHLVRLEPLRTLAAPPPASPGRGQSFYLAPGIPEER